MAAAPRETASRMNVLPSAIAPRSAKKSASGCTLRESHATRLISRFSAGAGRLASVPCSKSRSFILRMETRDGDESSRRSSVWFVFELRVSSSIWLNAVLILIPVPGAGLRILLGWCPELHGDFRASPYFYPRRRRLIQCKIATNQHRIETKPQGSIGYLAHGLPAEIGDFDLAALIYGHRQRRLPERGGRLPNRLHHLRCHRQRIGLPGKIHRRKVLEGARIFTRMLLICGLDQFRVERHIARHIEIRQDLFGNAFEHRGGHLSAFMLPNGRIQRHENGHCRIVNRRKSCEGSNELCA